MQSKPAARFVSQLLAGLVLQQWVLPVVITAAGLLIGLNSDVPPFYVFVGTVIVLAQSAVALLRYSEWRSRITAKDKLGFQGGRVVSVLDEQGQIAGFHLGFTLNNFASFPVEFEVERIESRVMDRVSTKDKNLHPVLVSSGLTGWWQDGVIELPDLPAARSIEGRLEAEIVYGRAGKRRHVLSLDKKVLLTIDPDRRLIGSEWFSGR
ncbi:hypothetical protein [Candidatus Poriferisodalis sp.]|uniref:hypothetical protein n=1 Tax=Candidatus Poriferisodalis sp. TaxID=3101277 RepID=UPI003B51F68E